MKTRSSRPRPEPSSPLAPPDDWRPGSIAENTRRAYAGAFGCFEEQRPARTKVVAALEDVHQFVEPAAPFGSLSRGGRLDEIVDLEVVFAYVLEDG